MHIRLLYYAVPRHHAQHTRNVGPILFARNENIAHVMPCVTAHAVMRCASKSAALIIRDAPGFTYGHAVRTS